MTKSAPVLPCWIVPAVVFHILRSGRLLVKLNVAFVPNAVSLGQVSFRGLQFVHVCATALEAKKRVANVTRTDRILKFDCAERVY